LGLAGEASKHLDSWPLDRHVASLLAKTV